MMNLIAPPDGRPWALMALSGASVVLNVVLVAALLMPSAASDTNQTASVADTEMAVDHDLSAHAPADLSAEAASQVAEPVAAAVPAGVEVLHGSVERNLAYTFKQAGAADPDKLSAVAARLFVWDLDLRRDLQKGDRVDIAYHTQDDLPVVLAARFRSNKLGQDLNAFRFQATGDAFPSYWSADGVEVPHVLSECPLRGKYEQITSLLKDRPTHKGMDFKAPVGTPVVTPRAGTVVRTNWNHAYNGNAVEVRWADGTLARFLHLSETSVQPGQSLAAGAVIGQSGNTGRSTAPHLHYELEKAGKTLDPAKVHGTRRRALPTSDRARFAAEVERLQSLLGAGGA